MRMKNFLVLLTVACALIVCASCNNLRVAYSLNGSTQVVCKDTKDGVRYGIGHDAPNNRIVADTPVIFGSYDQAAYGFWGYILYSIDKRTAYFFSSDGREVLSGKKCDSPDLSGLVAIKNDSNASYPFWVRDYWRHIVGFDHHEWSNNRYFIFPTTDGNVYAVAYNGDYNVSGPHKKVLYGLHGFLYQDVKTGKWGARTIARSNLYAEHRNVERDTPTIFAPEYDEVIEVEHRDGTSIWLARKGSVWTSRKVVTPSEIKNVPVNQQLLNRVRNMNISKTPKEAKGPNFGLPILAYGQRFGMAEASVVHL